MGEQMTTTAEVKRLTTRGAFLKRLAHFPITNAPAVVVHDMGGGKLYVGHARRPTEKLPYVFDLNLIGDTCYLLWIEIAEQFRGKGFGTVLYRIIEDAARELGYAKVQQTPSGKGRMEYLLRRGYRRSGVEAVKDL